MIFAVASANRKFIYADVGRPGVLGDATIFERSTLSKISTQEKWLSGDIPPLNVGNIEVRPYLMG